MSEHEALFGSRALQWWFCLQGFSSSTEEPVKFWCLQTVVDMVVRAQRYKLLPEERKQQLRTNLMSWLQSKGAPHTDEPASIKNKFAQLLVAVLQHDYPTAWPDFFSQLLATLANGAVSIDLFLRVLNALHEEIVVNEDGNGYDSGVAGRVKDGMRDRCLPQIADAWLTIFRLHESAPALSAACLNTVSLYVPWCAAGSSSSYGPQPAAAASGSGGSGLHAFLLSSVLACAACLFAPLAGSQSASSPTSSGSACCHPSSARQLCTRGLAPC